MSLYDAMKGQPLPATEAERNELVVSEVSRGFWVYHLSRRSNPLRSLCNAATMPTAIPLAAWGKPIDEGLPRQPSFCEACTRIAWPADGAD
jgi:hypothetical protein